MKVKKSKKFANGKVYAIELQDGKMIEVTDTYLPSYTKDAIKRKQNLLDNDDLGDRSQRWMIGVSTQSGCPVGCKFCATSQMKGWRNLTGKEIVEQVFFILNNNLSFDPNKSTEFKINYTRMGEPFLNVDNLRWAIKTISKIYPNTHHYVSTIGIKGADYSWIEGSITLQLSLHSLDEDKRNWLIPFRRKNTIKELGKIRTKSNLKTTLNMTLVEEDDFKICEVKKYFDKDAFFIKLSPINPNVTSEKNNMGKGVIEGVNLV